MKATPPLLRLRGAFAAVMLLGGLATSARAHEIPVDVVIHAFLKPEGHVLRVLVRVPMEAMRDVGFPMRGPGYLVLDSVAPYLSEAVRLWIADDVRPYEEGRPLGDMTLRAVRVSRLSDRSFSDWTLALAHVTGPPLPSDAEVLWNQAYLDALFEVPIGSATARFSIEPSLARLGVRTMSVIRFLPPDGSERILQYSGDPGLVHLDPRWYQAALGFVRLGVGHILGGIDHLLFILCLVIPVRRLRALIPVVTAFTVAHSITLVASALGLAPNALWFPPLIETLIAASIVYTAVENVVGAPLERRWIMAFGFGLVHGFGFSFALRESLQFAGRHLLTSLFSFNVGVEVGQVLVLLAAIPLLEWTFRRVTAERMATIVLSALVAHTAWHWMTARGAHLAQYEFARPAADAALVAAALRWAMLALICVGAAWLLSGLYARLAGGAPGRAGGSRPRRGT